MRRLVWARAKAVVALLCCVLGAFTLASPAHGQTAPPTAEASGPPVLAYYYTWFSPGSWNRAKTDYPALGRYSSEDPVVLHQHIRWAKQVGIQGFIVSWKSSATNNHRLRLLMDAARAENFKLAMIYQGLDFNRRPLPADRVRQDYVTFAHDFAPDPVFLRIGGRPLTIFSGTWEYGTADVERITAAVRPGLLVLSSEKSVQGYQRLAPWTDGDAYYWSSVDPKTNPGYQAKLQDMGRAVHADGKQWIAPFAPGFDARLVGGRKTVDRRDGETLRLEYAAARASQPDLLGLISWNEFSENSHVEPSVRYGQRSLEVLGELLTGSAHAAITPPGGPAPAAPSDSGEPVAATGWGPLPGSWPNLALAGAFGILVVVGAALVGRRRRRSRRSRNRPDERADE